MPTRAARIMLSANSSNHGYPCGSPTRKLMKITMVRLLAESRDHIITAGR